MVAMVFGSKHDQVIALENEVLLVNVSGYPKTEPRASSEIYAQCVFNLLTEIMSPAGELWFEHDLVQEIWVTHNKARHASLYNEFRDFDDQCDSVSWECQRKSRL